MADTELWLQEAWGTPGWINSQQQQLTGVCRDQGTGRPALVPASPFSAQYLMAVTHRPFRWFPLNHWFPQTLQQRARWPETLLVTTLAGGCLSRAIRGDAWRHSRNSAGWEFGLCGSTHSGAKGVRCTDLGQLKNHQKGDFPGGLMAKILYFQCRGAGVQSLARKSRSHMPPGPAPSSHQKKERITRKGRSRNRQQQRESHGQKGNVLVA